MTEPHLAHPAQVVPALQLDDDVDLRADVSADVGCPESQSRLQGHQRDLLHGALRAVGVHCGQGAGMARIGRAQEYIGLRAPELAHDETVRAKPQSRLQ